MKRFVVKISGIVQGVGFRPNVYNKAKYYNIKGFIKNCGAYVLIDIEGSKSNISNFLIDIIKNPPKLSKIEKVEVKKLHIYNYDDFNIIQSSESTNNLFFISPDISVCDKCLEEIKNQESRFYHYPFTNCTDCGPRLSIINDLPYDRRRTTMSDFFLCDKCREEYYNPLSRRFHAQAIACPKCGPSIKLYDNKGKLISSDNILELCAILIRSGKIIAIKGIGGFHLCCDAKSSNVVLELRKRKKRPDKAFAVMAKDLNLIKEVCLVGEVEENILTGREKPIVLLNKKNDTILSKYVAPNNKNMGFFLPYTPLLNLLFEYNLDYLIMTSANLSNNPIIYENEDAFDKLKDVADYFLVNDRDIFMPLDDSVVQVVNNEIMILRIGRGYAPITIKINEGKEIIALGALEKCNYAFCQNGYSYINQYLGDLKNALTYEYYKQCIDKSIRFFNLNIETIACDKNKAYLSNQYANVLGKEVIEVYHHHAHMVSAICENKIDEDVIGVIFDGTGLGEDKKIWGGEFLLGNINNFKRVGHLKYVTVQGNDSAIQDIWKIALSYLYELDMSLDILNKDIYEVNLVKKALESNINCFESSSMGRLFDCVSVLIGLRNEVSYEGQGAIELESIVLDNINDLYDFSIVNIENSLNITYEEIIKGIVNDISNKKTQSYIATKFHNTVVRLIIDCVNVLRSIYNINKVVLSGGVFQNKYLLSNTLKSLKILNFEVFYNKVIPINDNGIAFGQLCVANKNF